MIDAKVQEQFQKEMESRIAPDKNWKEIVAWVGDIPPLPQIAAQALNLIENPDTTAAKLTKLLGDDAALAARVLKISNSAMFCRQREITTLNQAIMTIGFKTLKGVIVAATLRQLNRNQGKLEQMIWENSTCTGAAARVIAIHMRKAFAEETFLLGLLHDLGKMVFMRQVPKEYQKVVDLTKEGKYYTEVEQTVLGFTHPLVGALVAKKWNFSLEICQCILHHHDPVPATERSELWEKIAIVQAADLVAHCLGYGHAEGYPDCKPAALALFAKLGIDEAGFEKVVAEIDTLFKESSSVF